MTGVTGFDVGNGCGTNGCSGGALNVRTGPVTTADITTTPGAFSANNGIWPVKIKIGGLP